jgi:hypothetical protein
MKILKTSAFCAMLSLTIMGASAQDHLPLNEPNRNKPELFADLPAKMNVHVSDLQALLTLEVGTSVKTFLASGFPFKGTVVSKADKEGVKSVVIRSTNRHGSTLTFTKVTAADGTVNYLGRLLSMNNRDAYNLVKEDRQYVFKKIKLHELVIE